ncbi:MAG: PorT family protein [Bacteroidales bacterium]|nr:PorT family protein [Bacteroidales bacterium]
MKKYIYWILLLVFGVMSFQSHAQIVKGALIGGINLTQIDGDEIFGYKRIGANVGAAAIIPFTDIWSLTLETIFSMEGSRQVGPQGNWMNGSNLYPPPYNAPRIYINGSYDLHLDYVRVPLIMHYNDRNLALGAGFQYGRLVKVSEWEQVIYNTTKTAEEAYSNNDYSILADMKYRIYGGLFLNFRFSYSMFSIRERTFYRTDIIGATIDRKQYHNTLTFRLMWVINDDGGALDSQKRRKYEF